MNFNRPDVAAILARKKILAELEESGCSVRTSHQMSLAFFGWPTEHIDYFASAHQLVIIATPEGTIEIRRESDPWVARFIST